MKEAKESIEKKLEQANEAVALKQSELEDIRKQASQGKEKDKEAQDATQVLRYQFNLTFQTKLNRLMDLLAVANKRINDNKKTMEEKNEQLNQLRTQNNDLSTQIEQLKSSQKSVEDTEKLIQTNTSKYEAKIRGLVSL